MERWPGLSNELKKVVINYLDNNKFLNQTSLAARIGISEGCIRNIINLKTKNHHPETVIKICTYISSKKDATGIINHYSGILKEFLIESIGKVGEEEMVFMVDQDEIFLDSKSYVLYKLAANRTGVTREQLYNIFGIRIDATIETLQKLEFIAEKDGYFHAKQKDFIVSPEVVRRHTGLLNDIIATESEHPINSGGHNLSESINIETYTRVCKIYADAINRIKGEIYAEKNNGEIPFNILTAIGSLDMKKVIIAFAVLYSMLYASPDYAGEGTGTMPGARAVVPDVDMIHFEDGTIEHYFDDAKLINNNLVNRIELPTEKIQKIDYIYMLNGEILEKRDVIQQLY